MLTYDFENTKGPVYQYIYSCIKNDILNGTLKPDEKLPSKRTFAENNGISIITIQNAYDQLISEGYIYTEQKKGYYVANIEGMKPAAVRSKNRRHINAPSDREFKFDFTGNSVNPDNFPFSVWAKISRQVMAQKKDQLMKISPASGVLELRTAIAGHLKSFRGMEVDPDQIVVGAGTEYLYGVIIELLGKEKIYTIETPGYRKLVNLYGQRDVECRFASMDDYGVTVEQLEATETDVAHICPNHHFPTGITMPASRRYEMLSWADRKNGRYIVEDDYDSEFRMEGKPLPTLYSIDTNEKVIYMNTFSKSLTPTIRVSYMVLPVSLAQAFYKKMSFYSCTVSNFEQYTLARFISEGHFEKHINRMRLFYSRRRKNIISQIEKSPLGKKCSILENDAGLHFLIHVDTKKTDQTIEKILEQKDIKIKALSDYSLSGKNRQHFFILNYSFMDEEKVRDALKLIKSLC